MATTDLGPRQRYAGDRISTVLLSDFANTGALAALPSNSGALELADRFVRGLSEFGAVIGPSGWGKSELLQRMSESLQEQTGQPIRVLDALEWSRASSKATLEDFLLLDDMQDAVKSPRSKHQLRLRLEQRFRFKRPTFVTMVGSGHELYCDRLLGSFGNWEIEAIGSPSRSEREQIVSQIATSEKVKLSRELSHLIAAHMNGNGRSIRGALLRLKLIKGDWSRLGDLAEASGILMPYLIGEDGWDIRDVVRDAVAQTLADRHFDLTENHLCAYFLRHEIHLREQEVADFLRLTAGQVYRLCNQTAHGLKDPANARLMNECRTAVFRALSHQ